jgi:energy-coupling factor transport system substrate-specific component
VGVVSILVSNCFLGHGLWTIFQITAIAIIGYLSGTLFKSGKNISFSLMCIWGGVSTFFIYNGIMTLYLLIFNEKYSFSLLGFVALYFFRLIKNIAYAVSTVFFLIFLSKPVKRVLVDQIKK